MSRMDRVYWALIYAAVLLTALVSALRACDFIVGQGG